MSKQDSKALPTPAFPSPQAHSRTYQLAEELNNLRLGPSPGQQWVGGFGLNDSSAPQYNYSTPPRAEKPLPQAPTSGGPLSLPAMEMPAPSFIHPEFIPRPPAHAFDQSTPRPPLHMLTPPRLHPLAASDTALPSFPEVDAQSPTASSGKKRASSVPPSSKANDAATVQCEGTTKAGKRCTRQVKAPPLAAYLEPGATVERFCFQHTKEILEPTGFYSHKTASIWVKYEDWIPDYLQPETKVALRVEMEKPASASDVPGYIYCYEIRNPKTPQHVHLKVGRAVNLVKRIDEWAKQCGSKEVVLRGWYPGTVDGDSASLLKGKVKAGDKGPHCHRLERLIHIELADLAMHTPYQTPDFYKGSSSSDASPSAATKSKAPSATALIRMAGQPCADCGAVHKEIFTFEKAKETKLKGREWDGLVQPVIQKWAGFVENCI